MIRKFVQLALVMTVLLVLSGVTFAYAAPPGRASIHQSITTAMPAQVTLTTPPGSTERMVTTNTVKIPSTTRHAPVTVYLGDFKGALMANARARPPMTQLE